MKAKPVFVAILTVLLCIAVGKLFADPGNGKHRGWPNRGIESPGHPKHGPNAYASPRNNGHP